MAGPAQAVAPTRPRREGQPRARTGHFQLTNLAARVRRFVGRHGCGRPAPASSWPSRAAATRWRCCPPAGRARRAPATSCWPALAHLNHQLRDDAARDEAFCRRWPSAWACRSTVARADVAALAATARSLARSGRPPARATPSSTTCAPRPRRRGRGRGAHPRRSGRDRAAAAAARRRHARPARRAAVARRASCGRCSTCGRAELRAYLAARGAAWVEDETNADLGDPPQPHPPRPAAAAGPRLPARRVAAAGAHGRARRTTTTPTSSAVADTAAAACHVARTAGPLPRRRRRCWRCRRLSAVGWCGARSRPAGAARGVRLADVERVLALCAALRRRLQCRWPACAWNVFPLMLSY